ncbi:MAG: hypothetical protein HY849_05860 [Nitrosomonadales bacterium]|nr:hypothetical protein [Nitrosomonadales bacterium]
MRDFARSCVWSCAVVGSLLAGGARAEEGEVAPIKFSGFGTLGASYQRTPGVVFRRDIAQPKGARSGQLSFEPDSMLGIQASAWSGQLVEASLQAVSRQTVTGNYDPQLTWGYLKLNLDEAASVRVGRLGVEMYMQGDSAEIGYANLLIRQPVLFYPRSHDGIDAEVTHPLGAGTLRVKGMFGYVQGKLVTYSEPYDCGGSRLRGGLAEYAQDGWTVRVADASLHLAHEIPGVQIDALRQALLSFAPNGAAIVNRLAMQGRQMGYRSFSVAYDSGPLQGLVSYNQLSSPGWSSQESMFFQTGYRLGKVTPYLALSDTRTPQDHIPTGLPNLPLTAVLNQGAAHAQTVTQVNQSALTLGARYELGRNLALKAQVDRIRYITPLSINDSLQSSIPVDSRGYKAMTLYSVALDFVF